MAKGIGNGFPLAATVTTPEIAATLSKALHFNTYGGNPMASAVGNTVLDVSYRHLSGLENSMNDMTKVSFYTEVNLFLIHSVLKGAVPFFI